VFIKNYSETHSRYLENSFKLREIIYNKKICCDLCYICVHCYKVTDCCGVLFSMLRQVSSPCGLFQALPQAGLNIKLTYSSIQLQISLQSCSTSRSFISFSFLSFPFLFFLFLFLFFSRLPSVLFLLAVLDNAGKHTSTSR